MITCPKCEHEFANDDEPCNRTIMGYDLMLTCGACPEQYDVYYMGNQVGYLRLRHGGFSADYGDCGGETVYTASPKGDGQFYPDERILYLKAAIKAIDDERKRHE